jgi:EmrB/QacA subfamily drug resistance transporter
VLAVSVLGSGIAALDATVVNIALPTIGRDFRTGVAALQWVMNGYTLTLAAFLLIGGSLGDRFGRRKVYLIGTAWFAVASAACGLAPDVTFLVITRLLQGVGAALLTPGSLAILEASFRPADRARAIGAWSGLGGIAVAAGPLVGGYLIAAASWRWIFFINIPIAVTVIALSVRHVPESRAPDVGGGVDYPGAAAMVVFLTGITFAFIEGPALGWSAPAVLAMALAGVTGLAVFLTWERRAASPMLPLAVFAQRQFAAVNAVSFLVYGALTGATFLLPVELQVVSGYSPLGSGLALLPLTIIMLVLSGRSGQLAARIGPRLQLTAGPLVTGAGLALLTLAPSGHSYLRYVLPAVLVFGLGLAITVAPLTATAMSSAPAEHAGIASAVNNDVARFGGLLAVALLPALAGITGSAYLHPDALAAGFRTAAAISGALCAAGGLLAAVTITNAGRAPDDAALPEQCLHCGLDAPPLTVGGGRRIMEAPPRGLAGGPRADRGRAPRSRPARRRARAGRAGRSGPSPDPATPTPKPGTRTATSRRDGR